MTLPSSPLRLYAALQPTEDQSARLWKRVRPVGLECLRPELRREPHDDSRAPSSARASIALSRSKTPCSRCAAASPGAHDEGNDSASVGDVPVLAGLGIHCEWRGAVRKDLALVSAGAEMKWQNNLSYRRHIRGRVLGEHDRLCRQGHHTLRVVSGGVAGLPVPGVAATEDWLEVGGGLRLPAWDKGAVTASLTASIPENEGDTTYLSRAGLSQDF